VGLHISFAGNITYEKADNLRNVLKAIPDDRLLLETDSPYLAPEPVRGKRNEPAFIGFIYEAAAELRGVSKDEIIRIADENILNFCGFRK